jgi:hypothetical protein
MLAAYTARRPFPKFLWGESRNCSHKRPANEQNDFRLSPKFSLSILRFEELNVLIKYFPLLHG